MDLYSATRRGSWHPLTSILEYEGAWEDREFSGVPIGLDARSSPVSTVLHELAHLASARTTMLGWILAIHAADALAAFEQDDEQSVELPQNIDALLGALDPLLEGIALFAQLDFEVTASPPVVPHPIRLYVDLLDSQFPFPPDVLFRGIRDWELYELGEHKSLLRRLLFDASKCGQAHYLCGYLYVKAAVAVLARRAPLLARPDIALPFLTRYWFDHPALGEVMAGRLSALDLLRRFHSDLLSTDCTAWERLQTFILDAGEEVSWFDHWRIHGQIASTSAEPVLAEEGDFFALSPNLRRNQRRRDIVERLRVASSVHFYSISSGIPEPAEGASLALRKPNGELLPVTLVPLVNVWSRLSLLPLRERELELGRLLDRQLEGLVREAHRGGRLLTLASYITLTEGDGGVVAWSDGVSVHLPWEPGGLLDENRRHLIDLAASWPPSARRRFAEKLAGKSAHLPYRRDAWSYLAEQLASDLVSRRNVFNHGLSGSMLGARARCLDEWVDLSPRRDVGWSMPDEVRAILAPILDMPGFELATDEPPIDVKELFPALPPVPRRLA